jgi:hypothetical protein
MQTGMKTWKRERQRNNDEEMTVASSTISSFAQRSSQNYHTETKESAERLVS